MQEILPGLKTEVWGYDGIFPGPTIEARRDRPVVVRQRNELPVPVSVHLHGGKTPPESDGYPTDLIVPKGHAHGAHAHAAHDASGGRAHGFKDYSYPNAHRAATLWYHDHRMDFTGPQVYRGLAGMYVLRDEVEDALPLPRGEKEVPLVITRPHLQGRRLLLLPLARPHPARGTRRPGARRQRHVRRHGPRQRRPVAAAGGLEHDAPLPHPERLQRPLLRPRARPAATGRQAVRPGRQRRWSPRGPHPPRQHRRRPRRALRRGGGLLALPGGHGGDAQEPGRRGKTRDVMRFVVARREREESVGARRGSRRTWTSPTRATSR